MHFDPQSPADPLCAEGGRALRRLQRLPFQVGNRATHLRFHDVLGESEGRISSSGGIAPISRFSANEHCDIELVVSFGGTRLTSEWAWETLIQRLPKE